MARAKDPNDVRSARVRVAAGSGSFSAAREKHDGVRGDQSQYSNAVTFPGQPMRI